MKKKYKWSRGQRGHSWWKSNEVWQDWRKFGRKYHFYLTFSKTRGLKRDLKEFKKFKSLSLEEGNGAF